MTVRLGVVGVGWWACFNHIPTAMDHGGAEIVALADPDQARLDKAGDAFAIEGRYRDFRDMLTAEALDGVMIATPHVLHTESAVPALERGCHVMVEKPMATSSAEARAISVAAEQAGKQVLVPCGWNFRDYTAAAAAMVRAGRIGQIQHIVCQMASALEDLFAGQPMVETAEHMFRPPPSTWADPTKAGGYGWGQMSHSLAWVYYVTGLAPQAVFAMAGKSPAGVDYFDAASVRMTNGVTMALSGSATVPKHCGFHLDVRIFGTEGMLLFDVERERLELRRRDGRDEVIEMPPGSGAYDGALPVIRFIEICAGTGDQNAADAVNGARVVDTLDALYRSVASRKLEDVGEVS
ncbi:MAG: Gfo/Idh/MocA family oxidoreductase [Pseudomonadota bacterium]